MWIWKIFLSLKPGVTERDIDVSEWKFYGNSNWNQTCVEIRPQISSNYKQERLLRSWFWGHTPRFTIEFIWVVTKKQENKNSTSFSKKKPTTIFLISPKKEHVEKIQHTDTIWICTKLCRHFNYLKSGKHWNEKLLKNNNLL